MHRRGPTPITTLARVRELAEDADHDREQELRDAVRSMRRVTTQASQGTVSHEVALVRIFQIANKALGDNRGAA